MTADMVAPAWMHEPVSAEQYESWTEEQCAGIEIVDGMVVVSASASKRRNRLARVIANALDAAGGARWNADTDFDVRLQDVPLDNLRPDVTVHRADTLDLLPTRPEHALLVVEVVLPGSETTDRIVKADQYARAGIASSTGGSSRRQPAYRSSTRTSWILPPAATGRVTCSPAR